MISMLLAALALGLVLSVICCALALLLFPWFRSGERKPGAFRPDESTGKSRAVVVRRGRRGALARSSELPLVGGVAMIVAIVLAVVITVIMLNTVTFVHAPILFGVSQWELLGTLLGATVCYGAVGFLDDWMKVHRGQGIAELTKMAGVVIVSFFAAIALNRLVPSARFAYSPYSDIPGLSDILLHVPHTWIVFFVLLTVTVGSTTSLAVDFTDGLDGLAGGVVVSAALAFAVIIVGQTASLTQTHPTSQNTSLNWPSVLITLAMVGAVVGFLPFNWPSSYKADGQGRGRRRARLIMGDTGSLALGGALALVAIVTRLELLLIYIGGVFVLEGVSALISARILVKFFRRFLTLLRFGKHQTFAHTEFPLPFLATPMHHHYELLNWDRQRLVYGAWTLGAVLAVLGVASANAPFTWERYLARLVALAVILFVWQLGPSTRSFFIGTVPRSSTDSDTSARRLGLFYGFPFLLFGFRLFGRVDTVEVTETALQSLSEQLNLWQRMSVFDARTILGYYCYRAGAYRDAVRVWGRIPDVNMQVRPMVADLLLKARHQVAMEGQDAVPQLFASAPSSTPRHVAPAYEPWGAFVAPESADPSAVDSGADRQFTVNPGLQAPRLEPASNLDWSRDAPASGPSAPAWGGNGWHSAFGAPNPHTRPSAQDSAAPDR